jgi:Lon-like protease
LARDVLAIALLVGILLIAPLGATSPYFLITPGGTYDIGWRIRIPADQLRPMGRMAFTAVYEQEASWGEVIRARVAGQSEIVPATDIRPPGTSQEQINRTNKRLIDESKPIAAAVALRAAGLPVEITGQGVEVQSVLRGMPADGVLQPDDVIVAVDGAPVMTADQLVQAITQHRPGDVVSMTVWRNGEQLDVQLTTRASPTDPNRAIVGVTVSTYLFEVRLPFAVDIESDNVGGPSAGSMFALGILDAITDGDLTRGYYVAGTGTIAQDGTIGAVGGAAEKALAAEQDGAQVFLVPRDDADEAGRWTHGLKIIPVARIEDAINALCALPPTGEAATGPKPTPCG